MAFYLQLHEKTVVPYLLERELSREGRVILATLLNEIRVHADMFISDPDLRLAPDSDLFWVSFVFRDPATQKLHQFRFILSDAAAQYSVLRVVFVEEFVSGP